ncbi:MAG: putative adhesin [Planctomycetota bacterium]
MAFDHETGKWPVTTLKSKQLIRFYCNRGVSMLAWMGQFIDNRKYFLPTEEISGPRDIWDYTLLPCGPDSPFTTLKLGNKSVGDANFITVEKPTRLSTFLKRYSSANLHWCACRVYSLKDYRDWEGESWRKEPSKSAKYIKGGLAGRRIRWNDIHRSWEIWFQDFEFMEHEGEDVDLEITGWLELPDCQLTKSLAGTKGLHGAGVAEYRG